jgi:hypothetical protein
MRLIFSLFLYYPQRFFHLQMMCLKINKSKEWSLKCYSIIKLKYFSFEMNLHYI